MTFEEKYPEKDTFQEMLEFLNFKQKKKLLEVIYLIEYKAKEDYMSFVIQQIKEIAKIRPTANIDFNEGADWLENELLTRLEK